MRTILTALMALGMGVGGALAGGGTVTSTEPGPQTLTSKTTEQMLDTMGVATPEAPTVTHKAPPPAPSVTHKAPPPAPVKAKPVSTKKPAKKKKAKAKKQAPKDVKVAKAGPIDPREAARQCATCHGYDGLAKIPTAPNIAGSSRQYLETQLKAFRSGKRENEVMAVIAQELSNAEIKAVAKWYAGLKVSVEGAE